MRQSDLRNYDRFMMLNIVTALFFAPATTAEEVGAPGELGAYVGMKAERLIEDLGEPVLRTPHELWYWNGPTIKGGGPGLPSPTVTRGRNGVVITGAGGSHAPLSFSRDVCNIEVKLDATGLIEAVEKQGPGCFEFIVLLKQRHAGTSTPP